MVTVRHPVVVNLAMGLHWVNTQSDGLQCPHPKTRVADSWPRGVSFMVAAGPTGLGQSGQRGIIPRGAPSTFRRSSASETWG